MKNWYPVSLLTAAPRGDGLGGFYLRAIGKREAAIRSAKAARNLGGRQLAASPLVFAASPLCVFAFKLLKPPSYAG